MRRSRTAVTEGLILFLGFTGIAVAATWPLSRLLPWATTYFGDPFINSWILSWVTSAPTGILNLYDAPLFHPSPLSLTFSENLFGLAIVSWPIAPFVDALTLHNLLLVVSFPLTGLATYYLGRAIPLSRAAAILGAVLFMMHPWRLTQLPHLQFEWALWLPLVLLATIVFCRKPTWRHAVWLAIAFLFNGLSNLHYLAFAVLLVPLTMVLLAPTDRRFWSRGAVAIGGATTILGVMLWPYKVSAEIYGVRTRLDELERFSANASDWLVGALGPELYRSWIIDVTVDPERWLFPGVALTLLTVAFFLMTPRKRPVPLEIEPSGTVRASLGLALLLALIGAYRLVHAPQSDNARLFILAGCVAGLAAMAVRAREVTGQMNLRDLLERTRFRPEEWACVSWIVVGFLGSLGIHSFLHPALAELTDLFAGIRAPARWAVVAYLGMSLLAGAATDRMLRSAGRRLLLQGVLLVIILLEVWPAPIRYQLLADRTPEVYEWLATCGRPVIAELPIDQDAEYRYLLGETMHQSPTVNGVSGFGPPFHTKLREMWNEAPIPAELMSALEDAGVSLVVVHADELRRPDEVRAWLDRELEAGRLEPLGRFADRWRGDWVFQVTGSPRPSCAEPTRQTGVIDAGSMLDLSPMAAPDWVFGHVDQPGFRASVSGDLTVAGWALAEEGVREIRVLVDHRRPSFQAERLPGPDLVPIFGSVAEGTPRWRVEIDRPDEVPEHTDLQVMIVDASGDVTYLPQVWFTWSR